jgi:hypothetical protein
MNYNLIVLSTLGLLFIVSFVLACVFREGIDDTHRALWFFFTGDYEEKK